MKLEISDTPVYQTVAGTARAAEQVLIRSQVAGRVLTRPVNLGEQVAAEETLLTLYNPEASPAAQAAFQERGKANAAAREGKYVA